MRNGISRMFSVNFLSTVVFYTCIPDHVLAASIWEKYTSSSAEDMWVLRVKPQMDMTGIVYAPFFDVNKRGRIMSYADPFGNKFQFDATIKTFTLTVKNASTRYTVLSSIGITICYLGEMINSWPII